MTQDEILKEIQEILVDALGVDDDEVTMEAKIMEDLGAESIDILDISFRLEKAFDIKIEQGEIFPEGVLNDPQYVQDGKVTDEGIAELKKRLPHADLSSIEESRDVEKFSDSITVETLVKFIEARVN